jgi:hypothetical protein
MAPEVRRAFIFLAMRLLLPFTAFVQYSACPGIRVASVYTRCGQTTLNRLVLLVLLCY